MPDSDPIGSGWKDGEVGAKIGEIMRKLWDSIVHFEDAKSKYPGRLVDRLREEYPGHNIAVFHNQYSEYYFVNGAHSHHECTGGPLGTSFGYEAWVFECGYFHRYGDAGPQNWTISGWFWSPGSEAHALFTNGYEDAETFWNNAYTQHSFFTAPEPDLDYIKQHCNQMAKNFPSGGWWDSHEFGSYNKSRGDLPPLAAPPAPTDIDDDGELGGHHHFGHGQGKDPLRAIPPHPRRIFPALPESESTE
ncbi:hypothetical protein TWF730_007766 [Orbilia blumenaviensis]|uniref:Uncharacterized protein n=1 Tax=Orbilia blumenaviensis TaxID=1796055 RepID=A0AAV9VCK2_9PEZI